MDEVKVQSAERSWDWWFERERADCGGGKGEIKHGRLMLASKPRRRPTRAHWAQTTSAGCGKPENSPGTGYMMAGQAQ